MLDAGDLFLAEVAGRVPAIVYQLRRGGKEGEHFPFVSSRVTELLPLTPAELRETSAPFWALLGPGEATRIADSLERAQAHLARWEVEFQVRLPSGQTKWIATAALPARETDGSTLWHGLFLDATERRRAQQAAKMDAIGRLAGGVAHDLNNLLTAIGSNGDMALAELPPDHAARCYIEHSRQAAERAADLTRQLLAFGQRQVLRLEVIRWNDVVTRAPGGERLLTADNPDFTVELQLDPDTPAVRADRTQLEHVFVNLVANAIEAMSAGGRLTIATGRRTMDEAEARSRPGMQPGGYAWLAVQDTGVGFDEHTRSRIFEPFFTTKVISGATGLGLSTVYGIVKQLNGYVEVESTPGAGTTVTVYLPVAAETTVKLTSASPGTPVAQDSITVLVAEDELSVREPVRRVLERLGYRVIDAPNGGAALALAAESGEAIDLLLTDVVMPGMSGSELARRLQQLQPAIRVLFMSGYSSEAVSSHGTLTPGSAFLQKPFSVTELVERVRETLGGASS